MLVAAMQPALEIRSASRNLLAMQLRDAVDERSQELRVLVLVAVPLRVVGGIAQPEVGAEVDDDRRLLAQLGHLPHGDAVRQRDEDDISRLQVGERRELEVGPLAQIGVDGTDELAGVPLRRDLLDRDLGMVEQQADQLTARVAAAANNRNVHHRWTTASSQPVSGAATCAMTMDSAHVPSVTSIECVGSVTPP